VWCSGASRFLFFGTSCFSASRHSVLFLGTILKGFFISRTVSSPGTASGVSTLRKLAIELIQFYSRILLADVIGSSTACCAEPLPGIEVPYDLWVFHRSLNQYGLAAAKHDIPYSLELFDTRQSDR